MTHSKFLKDFGLRYPTQLTSPKVINMDELLLPKNSVYIYIGDDSSELYPEISILNNHQRVKMFSLEDYSGETGGKYRKVNTKIHTLNKLIQHNFNNVEPLLQKNRLSLIPPAIPVVINIKMLDEVHKYVLKVDTDYYKFRNKLSSAINVLKDEFGIVARKRFLEIRLPSIVSRRENYEKALHSKPTKIVKLIETYRQYVILELYKLLDKKVSETSLFYNLTKHEMDNTVLTFVIGNKVSFTPLGLLYSMVKEFEVKSSGSKLPSATVKKLLLFSTVKQIQTQPISVSEAPHHTVVDEKTEVVDDVLDEAIEEQTTAVKELDELLDKEVNKEADTNTFKKVQTKSATKKDIEPTETINSGLEDALDNGEISEKVYIKQKRLIEEKKLIISPSNIRVTKADTLLRNSISVPDDSYLEDTNSAFDRVYITEVLDADKKAVVDSLSMTGNVVVNHEVEEVKTYLSETEDHEVSIATLNGREATVKFKLPIIRPDGTFKLRGNNYRMRKQKVDAPIRKINAETVTLTSYYSKIFIKKRDTNSNDMFAYVFKQLKSLAKDGKVKRIVTGNNVYTDIELPILYTGIGKYVSSLVISGIFFNFSYKTRNTLLKDKKLEDVEKDGKILIGKKGSVLYLIDNKNMVYTLEDKKYTPLEKDILDILQIDKSKTPPDVSSITINRTRIPLVLILIYYYGLDNLLSILKTSVRIVDKKEKINDNEYIIRIGSVFYIFNKDEEESSLLFSGLRRVESTLKEVEHTSLNLRSGVENLFSLLNYNRRLRNDIKLLEKMWMDPMTKAVLKDMKEPLNFPGLLIRANELLINDYSKHPNSMDEVYVKGYERLNGILYNELSAMMRDYTHKRGVIKTSLSIQPYAVINTIMNDSTTILIDDKNPIAALKQSEDITYMGKFGRNKDTITQANREFHPSEVGLISEATKDSKDVGVSMYMSASPHLTDLRGSKDDSKLGLVNILSTSGMISPFATQDDSKRLGFISIQHQHTIAMDNQEVLPIRTGYETVMAQRVPDKFVLQAEEDGIVQSVGPKKLIIKYKTKSKTYRLTSWVSKEESGVTFKHIVVTDLKKHDKVKEGEVIAFDKTFFARDIFDKSMVVLKSGIAVRTMMVDLEETNEDAGSISDRLSDKLKVSMVKIRELKYTTDDNIINLVEIGDKVDYPTPLFTIVGNVDIDGISKEEKKALRELTAKNPKAKLSGTITNIQIFYNAELKELPTGIRKAAIISDARLEEENGPGITGKVSSEYSVNGKPLKEGEYVIKIFIDTSITMETGDKAVLGNQLKFTVSNTFDNGVSTEDGEPIDLKFGDTSDEARVVNSPVLIGTTLTIAKQLNKKILEMYFD